MATRGKYSQWWMRWGCLKAYRRFWRRGVCGGQASSSNVQSLGVIIVRGVLSARGALKGLYATNAVKRRSVMGPVDKTKNVLSARGDGIVKTAAVRRNAMIAFVFLVKGVRIAKSFVQGVYQ